MRLVDTHTHAWGADTAELPWLIDDTPPEWEGAFTHRDLVAAMDRVGVDESVIVSMPMYGRERGNEYTMRSIEAHPDRFYGVGHMEYFGDPDDVAARLRQVTGHPRMLGVRLYAALEYGPIPGDVDRHGDWFLDDALDPLYAAAADLDTAIFVFPKVQQLGMVDDLVAAHPDVEFVVDHMAWIDETVDHGDASWAQFESVATNDNVRVKVSSVPRSARSPWPYEDLHPYLRDLLDWFGPERLLLGSDYPWMDNWASYEECLDWIDAVEFLSRRDRAYLRYRTFDEFAAQ